MDIFIFYFLDDGRCCLRFLQTFHFTYPVSHCHLLKKKKNYYFILNPQRQRDLEAQTCPATFLSNLVLINPRRKVGFS